MTLINQILITPMQLTARSGRSCCWQSLDQTFPSISHQLPSWWNVPPPWKRRWALSRIYKGKRNKLSANELHVFCSSPTNLPSHVGQGELDVLNTGLSVRHSRRSDSNKWQCRVGNAQSITANDSITFAQTSSDNVHLPDMFCESNMK